MEVKGRQGRKSEDKNRKRKTREGRGEEDKGRKREDKTMEKKTRKGKRKTMERKARAEREDKTSKRKTREDNDKGQEDKERKGKTGQDRATLRRLSARLVWSFPGKTYGGLFMGSSISSRDYGLLSVLWRRWEAGAAA